MVPESIEIAEELHESTMAILWGPVMNIAIILATYSYRTYAIILHAVIGFCVGLWTLAVSLTILAYFGFPDSTFELYNHINLGFACMIFLIIQILLGFSLKILNYFDFSSNILSKLVYCHRFLGYILIILAKTNYYIIFNIEGYYDYFCGFMVMDAFIAAIIIF